VFVFFFFLYLIDFCLFCVWLTNRSNCLIVKTFEFWLYFGVSISSCSSTTTTTTTEISGNTKTSLSFQPFDHCRIYDSGGPDQNQYHAPGRSSSRAFWKAADNNSLFLGKFGSFGRFVKYRNDPPHHGSGKTKSARII